jgi:hypothetical protein
MITGSTPMQPGKHPQARICVCGIIKNEAAGILDTLNPLLELIDEVALLDTGSTDGTPEIIEAWMKQNGIPGIVARGTWPNDYSAARNRSLQIARQSGCEWLLEIDADWHLVGNVAALKQVLAGNPKGDGFSVEVQTPVSTIFSVRIKRASAPWAWRGRIHEECVWGGNTQATIGRMDGIKFLYRNTTSDEDRSKRYQNDLSILVPDAEAGDTRSMFYAGQTFHCLGDTANAVKWYMKRGQTLSGPPGERAVALYRAGCIDPDTSADVFLEAFIADPSRSEPLWQLAFLLKKKGYTERAKEIAKLAYAIPYPKESQFVLDAYYRMKEGIGANHETVLDLRKQQLMCLAGLE